MPTTQTETQSKQILATLLKNLIGKLDDPEEEFNEAAKALEDFLRSPRTKVIFHDSKFIENFMRKEVMAVAKTANQKRKDLYAMVARVSKEYGIAA